MDAAFHAGGNTDSGEKTPWNPSGLTTNCGFCAIAYALELQTGRPHNADELYLKTLQDLGLERKDNKDPIPRMLIFPQWNLDQIQATHQYDALLGGRYSLADYTITAVASRLGLNSLTGDKQMVNALMEFATRAHGPWTLDDFVKARTERPGLSAKPSFALMKKTVESSLKGDAIIGSTDGKHFMTMSFDDQLRWKLFDPQNNRHYDGLRAKALLTSVALVERFATKR